MWWVQSGKWFPGVGGGFQESSWKNYMETGSVGKMNLRELVDI